MTFRLYLWAWWHMRPGHRPYAIIRTRNDVHCAACGSRAPLS